jgi:hypothetical protein
MKLTAEQKEIRSDLLEELDRADGDFFVFEQTVILVCPAVPGDAEFAHVAVAQCATEDKFKRKLGELLALTRWEDGEVIRVPYLDRSNTEIAYQFMEFLRP